MVSVFSITHRALLTTTRAFCSRDLRCSGRQFSTSHGNNMKLIQFSYLNKPEETRLGYFAQNGQVVDVNKVHSSMPTTTLELLKSGKLEMLKQLACCKKDSIETVDYSQIQLKAPVNGMDKVLCIGLNYLDHCKEQNLSPPEVPMFFSKFSSTVIGPSDAVRLRTDVTKCVDWEVELVVVIGKEASGVSTNDAYDYVAGYTVAQDISARDWQKKANAGQFLLGKSMDTFCPIGPCIVTTDELCDPSVLNIGCSVNGVQKQSSNTCQLVTKIPYAIQRLSSVMTLYPGDILLTGTPGGVGMYRDPPEYLKPGDVIESTIDQIGTLVTKVEKF